MLWSSLVGYNLHRERRVLKVQTTLLELYLKSSRSTCHRIAAVTCSTPQMTSTNHRLETCLGSLLSGTATKQAELQAVIKVSRPDLTNCGSTNWIVHSFLPSKVSIQYSLLHAHMLQVITCWRQQRASFRCAELIDLHTQVGLTQAHSKKKSWMFNNAAGKKVHSL